MRISCTVTSCGVPRVASVVKSFSSVSPFVKWIDSTGSGASSMDGMSEMRGTSA